MSTYNETFGKNCDKRPEPVLKLFHNSAAAGAVGAVVVAAAAHNLLKAAFDGSPLHLHYYGYLEW